MKKAILLFIVSIGAMMAQAQNLTITANNDTAICIGDTILLQASASGGTLPYTYRWQGGDWLECDTCANTRAFAVDSGSYTIVVTDSNLNQDTATVVVDIANGDTLSASGLFDIAVYGDTLGLFADSIIFTLLDTNLVTGYLQVVLTNYGIPADYLTDTLDEISNSFVYNDHDLMLACGGVKSYWDCEMYVNLCYRYSGSCNIYCLDTTLIIGKYHSSITEKNTIDVQLYPNPTQGAIHIASTAYGEAEVTILNMMGQEVHFERLPSLADSEVQLGALPVGVYMLRVRTAQGQAIHRVVKE